MFIARNYGQMECAGDEFDLDYEKGWNECAGNDFNLDDEFDLDEKGRNKYNFDWLASCSIEIFGFRLFLLLRWKMFISNHS